MKTPERSSDDRESVADLLRRIGADRAAVEQCIGSRLCSVAVSDATREWANFARNWRRKRDRRLTWGYYQTEKFYADFNENTPRTNRIGL
jgi:hypothetical protein